MAKSNDTKTQLVKPSDMPGLARRARRAAGLTQEDAAARLAINQSGVSKAENDGSGRYISLQRRMIRELAGGTCEGPLYRVQLPESN